VNTQIGAQIICVDNLAIKFPEKLYQQERREWFVTNQGQRANSYTTSLYECCRRPWL